MNGCRKCPAFAKCTVYEYRGSQCAALRSTYGIESDPEIITNGDRIRDMSDEEIAELLLDGCRGAKCEDQPKNVYGSVNCFKCRMNWLQQPAEEDKHGTETD